MNNEPVYSSLQLREIFHLEFLRWIGRKIKAEHYALKGGVNLRFFFKSLRYSEDMDLDVRGLSVGGFRDTVMDILQSRSFGAILEPFGIAEVVPPDMANAKQTETTQRFKIHLITPAGEDFFTKVEFSRRGFKGNVLVQPVSDSIVRTYKTAPLLVPHYDMHSAAVHKIDALALRTIIQARDVFDLYILSSQYVPAAGTRPDASKITKAYENIFTISFEQFRDTVVSYLAEEDQAAYAASSAWDEIKLKAAHFLGEMRK